MMIAVIRLKGKYALTPTVKTTLNSLCLTRLYTCTLLPENENTLGMIRACKDAISFGQVDESVIERLLAKRGMTRDAKKLSVVMTPEAIAKLAKEIAASGKPLSSHALLPLFFLAPPRGGFGGSKKSHAPFGPLGKNTGIGELIAKMA